jgi:hypothetical protein
MKRIVNVAVACLFLLLIGVTSKAQAQNDYSSAPGKPSIGKYSRDYVMMQVTFDAWAGAPDSIRTGGFSRGFNFDLMYDFPLKEGSHYSFGAGLGISTSNMFFKDQTVDVGSNARTLGFPSDSSYKHFKLATAYLEIPVEFRYRQYSNNANRGLKAGVGLKFGALANAHTKGKIITGGKRIEKVSDKEFFNTWRVSAMARIGWGNFSLYGSYSLTGLLKEGTGPTINPYSIGICISGL